MWPDEIPSGICEKLDFFLSNYGSSMRENGKCALTLFCTHIFVLSVLYRLCFVPNILCTQFVFLTHVFFLFVVFSLALALGATEITQWMKLQDTLYAGPQVCTQSTGRVIWIASTSSWISLRYLTTVWLHLADSYITLLKYILFSLIHASVHIHYISTHLYLYYIYVIHIFILLLQIIYSYTSIV